MAYTKTTSNVRPQIKKSFITAGLFLGLMSGSFTAHAQVSCGDVIGPNETVVLQNDISDCDGFDAALTVIGPATLDMNGYTISCEDTNGDDTVPIGIQVLGQRAHVRGPDRAQPESAVSMIYSCALGIELAGEGKHKIESLIFENGQTGLERSGIVIRSDRNQVMDNLSIGQKYHGIQVLGERNVLTRNEAGYNGRGIEVTGDKNKLTQNHAFQNGSIGFFIDSDRNTLTRNVALRTGGDDAPGDFGSGFIIHGERNIFKDNRSISNTANGFEIQGARHKFTSNFAAENDLVGFNARTDQSTFLKNHAL